MSGYRLRVPDHLVGLFRGLHPQIKRKISGSLKIIIAEPVSGKPLKDEFKGLRSFRVSRFRIVYHIAEPGEIQIVAIGPRARIYEETFRLIKRGSGSKKRVAPQIQNL